MTLRLLSDALETSSLRPVNNAGAGAWIFFSLVLLLMLTSGWFGLRTIRR